MNILKSSVRELCKTEVASQIRRSSSKLSKVDMKWKRPGNFQTPTTWMTFFGKKYPNTAPLEYKIKDVTPDLIEDVITHFTRYMSTRLDMIVDLGFAEDHKSTLEQQEVWRNILSQKMGLVAMVMDHETGKERIAGASATFVKHKSDENILDPNNFKSTAMKKLWKTFEDLETQVNIFEKYKTDIYMVGAGLNVAPQYRGEAVGWHLLMARNKLCESTGVPASVADFVGPASQSAAAKAGFKKLSELNFENYKQNDKIVFPKIKSTIALMVKEINLNKKQNNFDK